MEEETFNKILDLYQKSFFDEIDVSVSLKKVTVNKFKEKYEEFCKLKIKTKKEKDADNLRNLLFVICRRFFIIKNKIKTKEDTKYIQQVEKTLKRKVKKLCELDIKFFQKKYPDKDILEVLELLKHTSTFQKKSLLKYYETYYIPFYIKNNIEEMMQKNPEDEYPDARNMKRHFILHIGPTNSGKTYNALERLKQCEKGAYFGPLRLLALEVYDKFNYSDIPCNMITGEEELLVDYAVCQASTIEMFNENDFFDIVVVDEVQMLMDKFRGYNWTKAILGLKANEIHLCMAPEAKDIVIKLIERCHDTYEIEEHNRKTELIFDDQEFNLSDIQQGDALIVFSKKSVLALADELQRKKIKASVIYGNLPPETRRHQVEMFNNKETQVVVSTDAIGMGLNLPIQRIIFMETYKFDGVQKRLLSVSEIKQIAGRAGRMGMYKKGYVLSTSDRNHIKEALTEELPQLKHAYLGFPQNVLTLPFELDQLLKTWATMSTPKIYKRMNVSELLQAYNLYKTLKNKCYTKEEIYNLITCPLDIKNRVIVSRWLSYCDVYQDVTEFDKPEFHIKNATLNDWETYYKELDLYFQLSRKTNKIIDKDYISKEKNKIVKQINKILSEDTHKFVKKCNRCGKELPYNYSYGICQKCYERNIYWW